MTLCLKLKKEWYEKMIPRQGDCEVGAGLPPEWKCSQTENTPIHHLTPRIAFSTFVFLWRRNQGWDVEKLAQEAGIVIEEVLEIEHNPQAEPESSAGYKLAKVFGVNPKVLLEIAGLIESRTSSLREATVRFAARSESMTKLSPREREAFESFVTVISEKNKFPPF